MLNPATDKYIIEFSKNFFDDSIVDKYNNYLFHLNGPIKGIVGHYHESIQSLSIPGINLNITNVANINNVGNVKGIYNTETSVNKQFPGNSNINEILDGTVLNLTMRNTILNWMFSYEVMRGYYTRKRVLKDFYVTITVMDAAEIPLLQFIFGECFVATMPGLEFSFNQSFRESKTIDVGFAFSKFDVRFMIPEFKKSDKFLLND